jgi:hypothetical protein
MTVTAIACSAPAVVNTASAIQASVVNPFPFHCFLFVDIRFHISTEPWGIPLTVLSESR